MALFFADVSRLGGVTVQGLAILAAFRDGSQDRALTPGRFPGLFAFRWPASPIPPDRGTVPK
jgi:hypothetical protein